MTISSQSLTGDELTRFLDMCTKVTGTPKEAEMSHVLGSIVKAVISNQPQQVKDKIKSDIAAEVRKQFPELTGI